MKDMIGPSNVIGVVEGYHVYDCKPFTTRLSRNCRVPGYWKLASRTHNDILYEWGAIVQKLMRDSPDGKSYNIGGMYLEFDNSGADVNPVPVIDREDSLSYYNSLNDDEPDRDYLRIALTATAEDTTDEDLFPKNNVGLFVAQSSGAIGIHGNTFSSGAGSRVYGGALVAFPDEDDASQDIVFSRFYFPVGQQIVKPASSQIGVNWAVNFT